MPFCTERLNCDDFDMDRCGSICDNQNSCYLGGPILPESTASTQTEQATKIVDWMSKQKYAGDPILHAAVCCDFSGRAHFIKEISKLLARQ